MIRGIVTLLFRKLDNQTDENHEIVEAFAPTNILADEMGWPKVWLICPHCGAQSWRIPPHIFDPCPLVMEMAQTQGLKLDAEAATARRAGLSLEKQLEALNAWLEGKLSDDDE